MRCQFDIDLTVVMYDVDQLQLFQLVYNIQRNWVFFNFVLEDIHKASSSAFANETTDEFLEFIVDKNRINLFNSRNCDPAGYLVILINPKLSYEKDILT